MIIKQEKPPTLAADLLALGVRQTALEATLERHAAVSAISIADDASLWGT
ncbi:MAG: hypothetical protein V4623_08165 [Pseudomonadota bacterium]